MSWLAYGVAADGTRTGLPVTAEPTPRHPVVHLGGQAFDRVEIHWEPGAPATVWTSGPVSPLNLGPATVALVELPDGSVAVAP